MLNVLHGRFVANPAQNSPSHIMKGKKNKCQQFHTETGLNTPTLLIHAQPCSPFIFLLLNDYTKRSAHKQL